MTPLHHDRPVDDGRDVAPATTPSPARATTRRQGGEIAGKVSPQVPQQRQGKAFRTGSGADGAGRSTGKAVTAAGSLAARAKAATTAAAGSPAARSAAAKAATARTAASKAASAGAASARTAAARATTAARTAAATKAGSARAAAKPTAAKPTAVAKEPAPAAPVHRATPRPRPRPAAAPLETVPASPVTVPEAPVVEASVTDVPAFVDEALAPLQTAPAAVAPARRRRRAGRHLVPVVRRRSAFYVAAGLAGALSVGAFIDTDPAARAEAPAVAETVSVAEQLGIQAEPTTALADAESTRLLQELVVSRNERDAASTAAADAQARADFFAFAAYAEAVRPKVVAPVNGARLTSGFGSRWGTVHAGIDLAAPMRTPEYAVMDGVVLEAGPASGYGLAVYIQHDSGDVTVYGHMDEILVEPGQVVGAGDTIALLGNRGQSTGPHLHFEVHVGGMDGTKVDPLPWLRAHGIQI